MQLFTHIYQLKLIPPTGTYIPKDDITHLIKLSHYTERGESYNLCDITHSDTLGITFEQKH